MTVKEIVITICERSGINVSQLADRLDITQSTASNTINNNDGMSMKVENLIKWLDELDYQIEIVPCFNDAEELILDGESEF